MQTPFMQSIYDLILQDVEKIEVEKGSDYTKAYVDGAQYAVNLLMWFLSLEDIKKRKENEVV